MKSIIDRTRSVHAVLDAGRRWSPSTAGALKQLLAPELAPGETLPDLELVQELFRRALDRRWRRVVAADEACVAAEQRHRRLRAEVTAAVRELYRRLAGLRTEVRGFLGADPGRWFLGLAGKTSRDPLVLLRQADRAADRIRRRALPGDSTAPVAPDRARWAAPIENAAENLRAARARSALFARELEAVRVERRRVLETFNDLFVGVASWFEGSYRAAGRDDRATLVRPSRRRRGLLLEHEVRRPPKKVESEAESSRSPAVSTAGKAEPGDASLLIRCDVEDQLILMEADLREVSGRELGQPPKSGSHIDSGRLRREVALLSARPREPPSIPPLQRGEESRHPASLGRAVAPLSREGVKQGWERGRG